jgi:PASTA domain
MRRYLLRLEVLTVLVVAACLALLSTSSKAPATPGLALTAGPGDTLTLSNSKEGSAILSVDFMRPGDSVTDSVTLGNTGTIPGDLMLATSNLVDTPGAGGGVLSGELDLRIRDVTAPGSPLIVYDDKIDELTPVGLGALAAGDTRVYEFRVSFPDAGPGAENAFQGSSTSVEFDWTAVDTGPDLVPPETTITSGPTSLTADTDATFSFTADEPGSTFECSLDGGAFLACTSPQSYSALADGPHTLDVRATDPASNTDPTPDSRSWTVDATAPSVSLADPGSPVHGTVTLSPSADDGSGSGVASLVVQRSPAGAGNWTTIGTSWNTTGVADGSYDLRARATDNAGNTADSGLRTVAVDNGLPSAPRKFSGGKKNGRLVLSWKPATDAASAITAYHVYANSSLVKTLDASKRSVDMGRFKTSDARRFQVAAQDAAGNVSAKTVALVVVPNVAKLSLAKAKTALSKRGLKAGKVSYVYSSIPKGSVVSAGKSGLVARGTAVPLRVSKGPLGSRATLYSSPPYEPPAYQPPAYQPPVSTPPASPGAVDSPPPTDPPLNGGEAADPEAESGVGAAEPESFNQAEVSNPRRTAGFVLLPVLFLGAGAMALRARRRLIAPVTRAENFDGPILFWDERFLRGAAALFRRAFAITRR